MAHESELPIPKGCLGVGLAVMVGFIVLVSLVGCERIGPGRIGIRVNQLGSKRGVEKDFEITTGLVFYFRPTTAIIEYPTSMQLARWTDSPHEGDNPESPKGANEELSYNSREGMTVHANVACTYYLDPPRVPTFYIKYRQPNLLTFTHGYLRTLVRNSLNEAAEKYSVEELVGTKNDQFLKEAKALLVEKIKPDGVLIDSLGVLDAPRPPEQIKAAILLKVQAQQIAIQKQNEVIQTEAEAKKAVAQQQGISQSLVVETKARAESNVIASKAQAESNNMLNASLTDRVIEKLKLDLQRESIAKWNGDVPMYQMSSGAGNGMLFQMPTPQRPTKARDGN